MSDTQPTPLRAPETADQLRAVVRELFQTDIPSHRACPGHDSPMDYLTASFFGQEDLLVWANRGGGKTKMAAIATVLDGLFRAPARIRVLGGSFDQSDRLAEYIREMLEEHSDLVAGKMTRQKVRLVTGSEIRMLAQSQRAVRGQHVQKIRCDEVELFDQDVWRAVQFATRSQGGARGSIEVLSTLHRAGGLMEDLVAAARRGPAQGGETPAAPGSPAATPAGYRLVQWCLWEVIEKCPPSRRCGECPLADDCRGVARRADGFFRIEDAIAIRARSSRASWEAEMLCRGARRDDAVLPEFDESRHVLPVTYCRDWPLYRAMDFGYRSPLVCLWIQVTPGGAVHVLEEYVKSRLPLARHAAAILARDPGPVAMSYVDPAGRQKESTSGHACTELLAAAGIPCVSRASTIAEGLELIRAALAPASGEPTLAVSPRCGELIAALRNYHYPPPDGTSAADKPAKDGPDHLVDALRYFFVNRMRPGAGVGRKRY